MKRPSQHIIETKSHKALENLLPDEWVLRPLTPDYGIDYVVEIFKNGKSTGKFFFIQLKGTSREVTNHEVEIKIKSTTLQYYKFIPLPVLLIVYSTKTGEFWGLWINEYLKAHEVKENQKTVTLKLTASHLIDEEFIKNIEHNFSLELPRKVSVVYQTNHEIGEKYHRILTEWLKYFYKDLLVFDDEHFSLRLNLRYLYKNSHLYVEVEYPKIGRYELKKILINEETSDFLNYP